ncbi:MAG TPA: alpha-L-fucosidase, partial [Terriglobia bacterium]|nr:alpha-L-fucosidase [Terriglobia bacterium]
MREDGMTRRDYLKLMGAGSTAAVVGAAAACSSGGGPASEKGQSEGPGEPASAIADRERRMKWWHAARFGMFIHWGLYSVIGQHEWAMEKEGIP